MTSRRGFLISGAVLGVGTTAGVVAWRNGWLSFGPRPSGLGNAMDDWMATRSGLRRLGKNLDGSSPEWAALDRQQLAAQLRERLGEVPAESDVLAQQLRGRIAQDFAADAATDERVSLDGWQLSRTEALLALLAYRCLGDEVDGELPPVAEQSFLTLENWGPQRTVQGKSVNTQSDGHTGLWFRFAEPTQSWYEISIDGERQPTFSNGKVLTSGLHGALQQRILGTPGRYVVAVHDDMNRRWQTLGEFVVDVPPTPYTREDGSVSASFCAIELWGPQATQVGVAENPQPDGSMGVYVRTGCSPKDSTLYFDGNALVTTVQADIVTARLPVSLLQSVGEFPLVLRSTRAGEEIVIGNIAVTSTPPARPEPTQ